jgi:prolyl 4-hydroxylase
LNISSYRYDPPKLPGSRQIQKLTQNSANKYDRSHVIETGTKFDIVEGRTSSTAILEKGDPVVDCIRLRAAHFQGKSNATDIESLNVVRYEKTQKFDYHFDWFPELPREEIDAWDRWTSFFVFLDADGTVGGTTHFPNVRMPEDTDAGLCEYIECEKGLRSLAVKPIAGNAVFWVNRLPGGKGDKRSLHSGRPVLDGTKIGMNIWTSALARDLYVDETNKVF